MTAPLTPAPRDALSSAPRSTMETLRAVVLAMPMARTLGLRFVHAEPGRVEVEIPVSEAFSFRPGQLQATAVFAVADFAAVAAAGSVLPHGGHHPENCGPCPGRVPAGAGPRGGCGAPAHRLCRRRVGRGFRRAGAAVRHAARHCPQY